MTHTELTLRAEKWLCDTVGCGVVFRELVACTLSGESPDALGFRHSTSVLVECKASMSDFYKDKQKRFRRIPETGMGRTRYFMCPPNLIKPEQLPEKWGLLWVYPKKVLKLVGPESAKFPGIDWNHDICFRSEMAMMYSAVRRLKLRGYLPEIYSAQRRHNDYTETREAN